MKTPLLHIELDAEGDQMLFVFVVPHGDKVVRTSVPATRAQVQAWVWATSEALTP